MILSTKGRYGLKAVYELAMRVGEGPVRLKQIADSQKISEAYLEQLMASLRKAGIVTSTRGAQGGYILSDSVDTVSVGNVIRALEGPLSPTKCVVDDDSPECANASCCVTRPVWEKVYNAIDEVIDGISLADMINENKDLTDCQTNYDGSCK